MSTTPTFLSTASSRHESGRGPRASFPTRSSSSGGQGSRKTMGNSPSASVPSPIDHRAAVDGPDDRPPHHVLPS